MATSHCDCGLSFPDYVGCNFYTYPRQPWALIDGLILLWSNHFDTILEGYLTKIIEPSGHVNISPNGDFIMPMFINISLPGVRYFP